MEDKIGERWIGMLVFPCGCFTAFGSFMWFFYTYILVLLGSLLVEAADYGWASSFTCMSKKQHLREDSNEQLQCKVNSMM
jgi:hypothetical protein